MSIKKYKNKTIELFNNIFPCLQRNHKQIQDKPITSTNKGQNDEDFFQTNRITTRWIYKNIKKYGQISLALGQILLLILIIGSAFNYGVVYVFTLQYPIELTFEQFLAFGFSNLSWFLFLIFILYISTELVWQIKNVKEKNKASKLILYVLLILPVLLVYLLGFFIFYFYYEKQFIYLYIFLFAVMIFLHIGILYKGNNNNINYIRIITCIMSIYIFMLSNIKTLSLSGLGDYYATIMVDKNSFIKDMFDGFYDKNNKYHYKGNYIELKDVKVLSTLGDIAYVELCSENMEIGKTLDYCKKTIKVELIKKDIHIIRDGKKQNIANTENGNDKTNNESKEQNEQDLEKSKENKKEESATKNN
ncbi:MULTISPECIES: hypothetical protein [unclassified Campylobacter]|uniref:hypothetical protein n=1 Tax=unclassified Campylobacter TaxID=2593542 RepID=UPI001D688B84|nr:hypothetical protein [Campylobacter sp. RM9331]MBZ8006141.1 hypothetical protein [Campylobacter sp. RM9332]